MTTPIPQPAPTINPVTISPFYYSQQSVVDFLFNFLTKATSGQIAVKRVTASELHAATGATSAAPVKGVWNSASGAWATPYTYLGSSGNFSYTNNGINFIVNYIQEFNFNEQQFRVAIWLQ